MADQTFSSLILRMQKLVASLGLLAERKRGLMPDELFRLGDALVEMANDATKINEWRLAHNIMTCWTSYVVNIFFRARGP